jgi:ATP-binding cassette subfamily F protein 3
MLLAIHSLSLAFGSQTLFRDTGMQLLPNARAGLVGPNGSGKTTLLRIINGSVEADAGVIEKRAGVDWGYLPQEGIVLGERSVISEVESAAGDVLALQGRLKAAESELQRLDPETSDYHECLDRISHLEQQLDTLGAHQLRATSQRILAGLGFSEDDFERPCSNFSGGWQMRVALARLLLQEPDLLMLDEPTNHLDLDSLRWVEGYLQNFKGAILLISHDRTFLDNLCTSILSMERGTIVSYTGNYSSFLEQRAARREQIEATQKAQQRKIDQTERFIERFRFKASKAAQVQSRIKQLAKVERIETEGSDSSIHFSFPVSRRGGHTVLEINDLTKRYGDLTVFNGFSMRLERGDRIGVVGINGAGKSTLARIIAGREPLDSGDVKLGHHIDLGYFAQDQTAELDPQRSVLANASVGVSATETHIRSILGAFLFSGDAATKPVSVLSGGEKNRLALARMLLLPSNFLVLDEPTNHLDLTSKAVLQEALLAYDGTTFIVSHDRDFLNPVVNKILEITPTRARLLPGDLNDYLWKIDAERAALSQPASTATSGTQTSSAASDNPRERRRLRARILAELAPLRKELATTEQRISELEQSIATTEAAMAEKAFFERGSATAEDLRTYDLQKEQLTTLMERWSVLGDEIESMQDNPALQPDS